MSDLKIRIFKGGRSEPATTVAIPGGILKIASSLLPSRAAAALKEQGIDLEEIIRLSENPSAKGTLVEVDNHERDERITIALE